MASLRDYSDDMVMCMDNCDASVISTGLTADKPNIGIATLFNDILIEADSPALALQAVLTQTMREAYYDWLPVFDEKSSVVTATFEEPLIPVQALGFWVVFALICVHLTLCVVAGIAFAFLTKRSYLSNAWQAIHDVTANGDASVDLQTVGQPNDSDVSRCIVRDVELRQRKFRLDGSDDLTCGRMMVN